jgi:hypothetical protein
MKKILFWMISLLGIVTTVALAIVIINLCINCDI